MNMKTAEIERTGWFPGREALPHQTDYREEYFSLNMKRSLRGIRLDDISEFERECRETLGFTAPGHVCCIVRFFLERQNPETPGGRYESSEKYMAEIDGNLRREFPLYALKINRSLYVYIVNLEDPLEMSSLVRNLEGSRIPENPAEVTVGIGRMRNRLTDIWKSYSDAMMAADRGDRSCPYRVVSASDFSISYTIAYSFEHEKRIINCLNAKYFEELKKIITRIILKNRQNSLSHKHMNILFMQLFNTGIRYAAEKGYDIKRISTETEQEFFNTDNTELFDFELKTVCLLDFYLRIMNITYKETGENPLVDHILRYVDENYFTGLYIDRIAAYMNLSGKYIARVFKQKTGTSLADHISRRQIQESKRLLTQTTRSIEEIASDVGLPNRVTFFRLFRKYEGVSPSSYRNSRSVSVDQPY